MRLFGHFHEIRRLLPVGFGAFFLFRTELPHGSLPLQCDVVLLRQLCTREFSQVGIGQRQYPERGQFHGLVFAASDRVDDAFPENVPGLVRVWKDSAAFSTVDQAASNAAQTTLMVSGAIAPEPGKLLRFILPPPRCDPIRQFHGKFAKSIRKYNELIAPNAALSSSAHGTANSPLAPKQINE
jgi:hypothetical protein